MGGSNKGCDMQAIPDVLVDGMADLTLQAQPEDKKIVTFTNGEGFDLVRAVRDVFKVCSCSDHLTVHVGSFCRAGPSFAAVTGSS